jgi:hypothetical protein
MQIVSCFFPETQQGKEQREKSKEQREKSSEQ